MLPTTSSETRRSPADTPGGSTYYYMQDGPPRRVNLGSVRNLTDSSETTQNIYDTYAFGDNIGGAQTVNIASPYRYTGREFELGSYDSTHYYRNRYYIPYLGIFASRDAIWADVTRGWGYVGNNPVMLVDPWGLNDDTPADVKGVIDAAFLRGDAHGIYASSAEYAEVKNVVGQMNAYLQAAGKITEFSVCMGLCLTSLDLFLPNRVLPGRALTEEERAAKLLEFTAEKVVEESQRAIKEGLEKTERVWLGAAQSVSPSAVQRAVLSKYRKELHDPIIKMGEQHLGSYAKAQKLAKAGKIFNALSKTWKVAAVYLCARQCGGCLNDETPQEDGAAQAAE